MSEPPDPDDMVVVGAIFILLAGSKAEAWPDPENPTALLVKLPFMQSTYRLTVTHDKEPDEQPA